VFYILDGDANELFPTAFLFLDWYWFIYLNEEKVVDRFYILDGDANGFSTAFLFLG